MVTKTRLPPRNAKGRFRKRRKSNPGHRRRVKHRGGHRRRRANPSLYVANPSRKQLSKGIAAAGGAGPHLMPAKKRAKRRKLGPNGRGGVEWRRRAKSKRRYKYLNERVHRTNPGRRRRRRSNPSFTSLRSLMPIVKVGISGGLGIVAARLGGGLYDKYARQMVLGDGSNVRSAISDVARIAAMAAVPILAEKYVVRHVKMLDSKAFLFGGLAEAGRNLVGVGVRRFVPSIDRHTWGLDGLTTERSFDGLPAGELAAMGLNGLVDEGDFSGMVAEDAFGADGGLDAEGDMTE